MRTERPHAILSNRYVLEHEVGRGGMGTVWRAIDEVLDRTVAVKVLHRHLTRDPAFTDRFTEAARDVAGLSHPGIARVLDTGTHDGTVFIVTDFVEGDSLRALLSREGAIDPDRALGIQSQLLVALAAAHRSGLLHLDLKPENVLIDPDGRVHLADTALARAAGRSGEVRTDIRAAGAILYEMLTGRAPAGSPEDEAARLGPDPPRALRPGIPRTIDAATMSALAAGFASADDFAAALPPVAREEAMRSRDWAGPPSEASASPSTSSDAGSWFRSWMLVPLLVLVVVAGAVGVGLWAGRLEIGGPLGVRPKPAGTPRTQTVVLPIATVSAHDPFGDDTENDSGLPRAVDGDPTTAWESENYFDGRLNKPGVGLLFDLGSSRTVTGFRLITPAPGFRFLVLVGDDPATLVDAGGPAFIARDDMRQGIAPASGRYVLLWITTVVPVADGNRAEVAEFRVLGEGG